KNLPVIINDRPDMVLALGCSGVHLGKGDISAGLARRILGENAIIGRTVRDIEDIRSLKKKDVDYVSIGPVYRTPLKPYLKTVSRFRLREVCEKSSLPVVAIGGINSGNARELAGCGVKTVAFVRYGIAEKNTREKIEKLRKIMDTIGVSL
ncbi:MAG: thiamine phosphate synthase, partial [Candidatus Omnitrophota bacterium]